ncbi:MAG: hypothetical protein BroJett018_21100 [Chloroflexota bacterium]|nr:hypothetical protein [Chloroflexota bacterium]NOG65403.1 hypothetical protein [Chloroflexota bacterium]GIK64316.1 MAG: hypothetical protein BroJett018_21100 [Chloroflexota bacterium]
MKLVCAPLGTDFKRMEKSDLQVVLYGRPDNSNRGFVGASIKEVIHQSRLRPDMRAWDLLSIALSVVATDLGVRREASPDGWTRELELSVAVKDAAFWNSQKELLEQQLRFLTTDLWHCSFIDGGFSPDSPSDPVMPVEDCISLLSGGLDSFVGTLDLVARANRKPYLVSQVALGDKNTQKDFAAKLGEGLQHLQLNHNVHFPIRNEPSQRARSFVFLAYGVLLATALKSYYEGEDVILYICENGFISINPPLTDGRLGSLSTRTTHPVFLQQFQKLLDTGGIRVKIENPYQFRTKGEMLIECVDQEVLYRNVHLATSCGRYARNRYRHCGRCIPCLVRRAAILAWGRNDQTDYVFDDLSWDDAHHARFDDVRSVAMAIAEVASEGFDSWIGISLNSTLSGDVTPYRQTVERGLRELQSFFEAMRIT